MSINVQAWLPAQTVASIARYMELSGHEGRQLSAVTKVAVEVLGGILKNKGISFETETEAVQYLKKRGFPIATRRITQQRIVNTLQEEALLEVSGELSQGREKIEEALQKEGL